VGIIDDDEKHSGVKYDRALCAELAQHVMHVKYLPVQCRQFQDIIQDVQSHESDDTHPTQWMV